MPWCGGVVRCTVWFGYANGRECFFVEPHSAADLFGREREYGSPGSRRGGSVPARMLLSSAYQLSAFGVTMRPNQAGTRQVEAARISPHWGDALACVVMFAWYQRQELAWPGGRRRKGPVARDVRRDVARDWQQDPDWRLNDD